MEFLNQLFNVNTIALLSAISGVGYKIFKGAMKKFESRQDQLIFQQGKDIEKLREIVIETSADLNREVLRLQLLQGMDADRLSESEILYFYDKYKKLGGNSFVEDRVEAYLLSLKGGDKNDK